MVFPTPPLQNSKGPQCSRFHKYLTTTSGMWLNFKKRDYTVGEFTKIHFDHISHRNYYSKLISSSIELSQGHVASLLAGTPGQGPQLTSVNQAQDLGWLGLLISI